MVRRNRSPLSGLSDAERKELVGQLRDALLQFGLVRNAGAVEAVHPPMTTRHAHSHHAYDGADGSHAHTHEHKNDANHDHSHADLNEAVSSAERARQGRRGAQVVNSAFQRAADGIEAALPPEWRGLYRDTRGLNGPVG
jgi:hypothetical protein